MQEVTRLNLGCGWDLRPGHLNVDGQAFHNPDLVADIIDLHMLPSLSYSEIVAQDVLEHFKWSDTPVALYEWNRLLVSGGKIFLRSTYLNGLFRLFENPAQASIGQQKHLIKCLFSMQKYEGDFHLTGFTEPLIRYYLWDAGFKIDRLEIKDTWLFEVWATKTTDLSFEHLLDVPSDTAFVYSMYEVVLHRQPDPAGLETHVAALQTETRRTMLKRFLLSDERQARMEQLFTKA